jgi:hypothetical protein
MTITRQRLDTGRDQRHAILVGLDLLGDADDHRGLVR